MDATKGKRKRREREKSDRRREKKEKEKDERGGDRPRSRTIINVRSDLVACFIGMKSLERATIQII